MDLLVAVSTIEMLSAPWLATNRNGAATAGAVHNVAASASNADFQGTSSMAKHSFVSKMWTTSTIDAAIFVELACGGIAPQGPAAVPEGGAGLAGQVRALAFLVEVDYRIAAVGAFAIGPAGIGDGVGVRGAVVAFLAGFDDAVAAERSAHAPARIEVAVRRARERTGPEAERRASEPAEVAAVARLTGLTNAVTARGVGGREQDCVPNAQGEFRKDACRRKGHEIGRMRNGRGRDHRELGGGRIVVAAAERRLDDVQARPENRVRQTWVDDVCIDEVTKRGEIHRSEIDEREAAPLAGGDERSIARRRAAANLEEKPI